MRPSYFAGILALRFARHTDECVHGGWLRVKVDKSKGDAVLSGLMATFITKQAYLTLPMGILTLFGRPQDYGLAQAEPI